MSWYSVSKPLDKLLLSYPTLDQLFSCEGDLIAQLKAFNSRLLEYLTNTPDLVRQAIEYIILPPKQSDSADRKYKYPLLSVEMVQTQAVSIINGFFKQCSVPGYRTNLEYLYSLLDQRAPLLLLSAGYFFRVNNCLLNLRFKEITDFVYSRPEIFKKLLQHSQIVSVTNTVQILLSLDASKAGAYSQQRKNLKVQTVWAVINKLRTDSLQPTGQSIQNLTNILLQIVQKYFLISDGKSLLQPILTSTCIQLLIDLACCNNPFTAIPIMTLLISIINYYSFSSMNNEDKEHMEETVRNIQRLDQQPLVVLLSKNYERIMGGLAMAQKLGLLHYKVLELLCHSVSLSSMMVLQAIKRAKYLEMLLELLFKHENCNIAHTLIERTYLHLFVNQKKFYDQYKFYIFCQMNVIGRTAGRIVNQKFKQLKTKGYFGHLLRIIKIYSTIQTTNQSIINIIRENSDLWAKVTREIIKPHQDICFKQLGTYEIQFNPSPIQFKVTQTSSAMLPRPDAMVMEKLTDERVEWTRPVAGGAGVVPRDSIMSDDKLFNKPLDEITKTSHLFEKGRGSGNGSSSNTNIGSVTSNTTTTNSNNPLPPTSPPPTSLTSLNSSSSPNFRTSNVGGSTRKLQQQLQMQRTNSPQNQSFKQYIQKKKIQAEQQIKLQRTLSQQKRMPQGQYGARSPSPRGGRKKNSWTDEPEMGAGGSKKQISQSVIVGGQHDRNRKDVPKVKVHTLLVNPIEKRYKKVDERDMQLLSFLGIQLAK